MDKLEAIKSELEKLVDNSNPSTIKEILEEVCDLVVPLDIVTDDPDTYIDMLKGTIFNSFPSDVENFHTNLLHLL